MTRGLPTRLVCGATAWRDGEGLRDRVVQTNALVCILSFVQPQLPDHSPAAKTVCGVCILQPVGSS